MPSSSPLTTHVSLVSSTNDLETAPTSQSVMQSLPADIRLNMLTGLTNPCLLPQPPVRSLTSSTSTVHERPKDALARIDDLIRRSSVQDVQKRLALEEDFDDKDVFLTPVEHPTQQRRRSIEANPFQFYIDETKKLTENLDNSIANVTVKITNLDDEVENAPETDKVTETSFCSSCGESSRSFRKFRRPSLRTSIQRESRRRNRRRRN